MTRGARRDVRERSNLADATQALTPSTARLRPALCGGASGDDIEGNYRDSLRPLGMWPMARDTRAELVTPRDHQSETEYADA